jgi:hypothetical protein
MIVPGSASPLLLSAATAAAGYNLTNSLRFRASVGAFLNRTPASAGNQKVWTWSAWIKRGSLTSPQWLFAGGVVATDYTLIRFGSGGGSNDNLEYVRVVSSAIDAQKISTAVYRDPSAWYHIVVTEDAVNSVARVYVNGTEITYSTNDNPSNVNGAINAAVIHNMGRYTGVAIQQFDGYMDEINFIDGQALTPSSFGAFSSTTGVWQPIKYAGTYGTNGFYLPFIDNSALTTSSNVGLGRDYSGNGNFWVTNNISITAGVTYDSMTDVPTLTNATTANYCVLNQLNRFSSTSISNANLTFTSSAAAWQSAASTMAVSSGKWYWEITCGTTSANGTVIGISNPRTNFNNINTYIGEAVDSYSYYSATGQKINNAAGAAYGAAFTTNDIIGVALDLDVGTLVFYKNNVSQGTAYSGLTGSFCPSVGIFDSGRFIDANFGQRPFTYTPPTGFNRLNTFNLPTPTIGASASTLANKNFDATTYTGNNGTQSVTNSGSMQPDLVWVKNRSATAFHYLTDSVRGANLQLYSNSTVAETSNSTAITGFTSTGFTLGNNTDVNGVDNYVGWQWRANGAAVTNTAGTQTSQVSANTSAGFSIATFTTPASGNFTVGHGLGVAPSMYIIKRRGNTSSWGVWHQNLASGTTYLLLDSTAAQVTDATVFSASPTSTVLNLGSAWTGLGAVTSVAYCFSQIAGYSAFGLYTGNGSATGPFIYTGFRPKFIMIKQTSSAGNDWQMLDSSRNTFNPLGGFLQANTSAAESSADAILFLSNGFSCINTAASLNSSGSTYIYMAFAESPFKYSLAR